MQIREFLSKGGCWSQARDAGTISTGDDYSNAHSHAWWGASDSCTPTVTVVDNTAPSIACPNSQTISADASCQAVVPYLTSGAAVSDNCSAAASIMVEQSPAAGTVIGLGTTMVALTATIEAGNTATCSSAVTVTDTQAPVITAAFNPTGGQNNEGDEGDDNEAIFTIVCHATDNCDPDPTLTALIEVPTLINPEIEFKVKKEKKLTIDVKKNKVEAEGPDPEAFWAEVQTDGGIGVSDGHRVEIKLKKNPDKFEYEFDELGRLAKIEAPQATLRCTATGASRNEGPAIANPPLIPYAADSQ